MAAPRRRGVLGPLVMLGALWGWSAPTSAAQPRWPTWPTEIHRISVPLVRDVHGKENSGERQRVAAIEQLDQFATGAILDPLLHALDDSSPQVRREALRMCFEREVVACIPGAANQWSAGGEPTVRVAALKVLALDPDPSRAALLIEALRDPSEVIRAQAADFLGSAPLRPDVRRRARTALLSKLADVSVVVRRRAVLSLGMLGPGEGALSIARLLEDPEPTVRSAAAEALSHYRDATAVPALRRAIASPNEASVARSIIDALAVLPDESVEEDLLALLDDPPPGLDEMQLANAISRRPHPSPTLLRGLVDRLDEPPRRAAALHALLGLGSAARPVLEQAQARGLAPAIAVEVDRLLAALDPPPQTAPERPWPAITDQAGWRRRLAEGDIYARRQAAWTLAERDPPWRVPAAVATMATPGSIAGRRTWVLTLAARRWSTPHDHEARARLEAWARDPGLSGSDRCLALAALGARRPDTGRRVVIPWASLAHDPDPRVRACTALALGQHGDHEVLPALLLDDHARVRTSAALGLALTDRNTWARSTMGRLTAMALEDRSAPVRVAAARALEVSADTEAEAGAHLFVHRADAYAWREPLRWIEVTEGDRTLWLPALGSGPWRFALIPGLRDPQASGDTEPALTP